MARIEDITVYIYFQTLSLYITRLGFHIPAWNGVANGTLVTSRLQSGEG